MLSSVEPFAQSLGFAHRRFTYGLTRVPEDRLHWSPGGSAPTPMVIAGKVAGFVGFIGGAIQARAMAAPPEGGFPPPPDTVESAIAAIDGAFARLQSGLATLTEPELAIQMRAPWGQDLSIAQWIAFVNQVIGYFQGQLNLVQLAYGDEDANIPPGPGSH